MRSWRLCRRPFDQPVRRHRREPRAGMPSSPSAWCRGPRAARGPRCTGVQATRPRSSSCTAPTSSASLVRRRHGAVDAMRCTCVARSRCYVGLAREDQRDFLPALELEEVLAEERERRHCPGVSTSRERGDRVGAAAELLLGRGDPEASEAHFWASSRSRRAARARKTASQSSAAAFEALDATRKVARSRGARACASSKCWTARRSSGEALSYSSPRAQVELVALSVPRSENPRRSCHRCDR